MIRRTIKWLAQCLLAKRTNARTSIFLHFRLILNGERFYISGFSDLLSRFVRSPANSSVITVVTLARRPHLQYHAVTQVSSCLFINGCCYRRNPARFYEQDCAILERAIMGLSFSKCRRYRFYAAPVKTKLILTASSYNPHRCERQVSEI
jgi:hypothetical protein